MPGSSALSQPDVAINADWRRPAYALPIAIASALIALAAGRFLLGLGGFLQHNDGVFAGTGPLATFVLVFLVSFEIPRRKLILGADSITIESGFGTRVVAWADVADVQPGTSGWMNVNRRLPVAARLVIHGTAETVPVPDVFAMKRQEIHDLVRRHWLSARGAAIGEAASRP